MPRKTRRDFLRELLLGGTGMVVLPSSQSAYSYVANGKMIGGFALAAYPAQYGVTGVMTFIVSHDGVVYEKDLGPESAAAAAKMTRFNPDASWKRL